MKKLLKIFIVIGGLCFCFGFAVSKLEKKKGWADGHKAGWYERNVKRALDIGLSLMALVFLWPVMAAVGAAVRLQLGKPVLFTQERPGLGGAGFTIRKYRTMLDGRGTDEERLTGFGRILRSTSLDELPELVNILRGDMSLVGPRPLLTEYLDRYSAEQKHRHDVRPGLTGLAQVSGRNGLSWEEKFKIDVTYVNNVTFLGDLKILVKTILTVLRREGISSRTSATMTEFMGG